MSILIASVKEVVDRRTTGQARRAWVATSSLAVVLPYDTPVTPCIRIHWIAKLSSCRPTPIFVGLSEFLDPYIETPKRLSCERWEHMMNCFCSEVLYLVPGTCTRYRYVHTGICVYTYCCTRSRRVHPRFGYLYSNTRTRTSHTCYLYSQHAPSPSR